MSRYARPEDLLERPFETFGEEAVYIKIDYSRNEHDETVRTRTETDIHVSTETTGGERVQEATGTRTDAGREFFSKHEMREGDLIRWGEDDEEWLIKEADAHPDSPALVEIEFWHAITERIDALQDDDELSERSPLERAFRAHIRKGSSYGLTDTIPVIPGEEKGLAAFRPDELFATALLISDMSTSWPDRRDFSNGDIEIQEARMAEFSVQWVGPGAGKAAKRFDLWAISPLGQLNEGLATQGGEYEFRLRFPIAYRPMNQVLDEIYEERIAADVSIDYVARARYTDAPGVDEIETGEGQIITDDHTYSVDIPTDQED